VRTTAFVDGSVFDGHRYLGPRTLVVRDGRVTAETDVPPGADVVDMAGGLVSPGFTDAHCHPIQGGLERLRCDLSEESTREGYLAAVKAYADAHPDREWVLGGGWAMPAFPGGTPRAADLDTVVPDRPAFLPNRDHHGAWVNSRALELAGIDQRTPDPADGRIERDADGNPTGTLHEGAMALVSRLAPGISAAEYYGGLIESGALRGDRFLQIGLRGYWPGPETLGWMAEQNMRSYEMTEIGKRGLEACLDEAFEIALDECDAVFLSVDIDVCDPGHAPGTGTPEPGGLSSRQLLDAVRRICRELPVAGIDVVEVSPPYDHAEITAYLANRVCLEALAGLAVRKHGISHDPAGPLLEGR
jgi:hypothetical protein